MLNITGKYVTVFQPEIKTNVSELILFANLSTSKKNTDKAGEVSYENMYWKGRFVGNALEPAKNLKDGDKIDIIKGAIENRYDKEKKALYVDVTIFEFEMSNINTDNKKSESKKNGAKKWIRK